MKLKHTTRKLNDFGRTLILAIRKELKQQQHIASGNLLRSFKSPRAKNGVLNIMSSVGYWKAVNDPKFAKNYNYNEIKKWVIAKRIDPKAAGRIYKKLINKGYGKPYVYWSEGNTIERTDFAGIVARNNKEKIAQELAPSIGVDVALMISEQIRKNTNAKVVEQF
jgi:hypothetical protein|tara:strand:- start:50 stop:544 length:495 start_codon:yes stop_codon:yes gene_type:complete